MITTKCVFVLGAGASEPYGFPLGSELIDLIHGWHNSGIGQSLEQGGFAAETLDAFSQQLRFGQHTSIDDFLAHRPDLQKIGKALISAVLVHKENEDRLFYGARQEKNIYKHILAKMRCNSLDAWSMNGASFVTFNYDRSLEHFLMQSLQATHNTYLEPVADVINTHIPIVHIHGQLGFLAWQIGATEENIRAYSHNNAARDIQVCIRTLKTISEHQDDSSEITRAKQLISEAKVVFFLGYSYHADSMERLGIGPTGGPMRHGTTMGFSVTEARGVVRDYGFHDHYVAEYADKFAGQESVTFLRWNTDFNKLT